MDCKVDDTPTCILEPRSKLLELQHDWERSCAFLAQLEAGIGERLAACEKRAVDPTVRTNARVEDEADAADLEAQRCNFLSQSIEMLNNSGSRYEQDNEPDTYRRGNNNVAVVALQARQPSTMSQIQLRFETSEDQTLLDDFFMTTTSTQRLASSLMQPRYPKPPHLQRSVSLQKSPAAPAHRARLLRAGNSFGATASSSTSFASAVSAAGEGGGGGGGEGGAGLEPAFHNPSRGIRQPEQSISAPTAPATISVCMASAVPNTHKAIPIHDGQAFTTVRRFSLDHEQLRLSPALVPSIVGGSAQRGTTIGGGEAVPRTSGNGSTAMARPGIGATLSFRRMEAILRDSEIAPMAAWDGCVAANNSSSSDKFVGHSSSGGGIGGGKAAPAPFTSPTVELPALRPDPGRLAGSHCHELAPLPRTQQPVTMVPAQAAATTPAASLRSEGFRPSPSSSLRSLQSFKCALRPDGSSSSTGAAGCSTASGMLEGGSCIDAAVAAALVSLSPKPTQPSIILGPLRPWQQQLTQPGLAASTDSGSPSSPREAATAAFGPVGSISMPRQGSREEAPQPQPPPFPRQQQQQQQQRNHHHQHQHQHNQLHVEDEPSSQVLVTSAPPGHLRTLSMGMLRLNSIPEEGSAAPPARRSTGQFLEPGGLRSLHRTSVGGCSTGSASGNTSGRFPGRVGHDVQQVPSSISPHGGAAATVAVQLGVRRASRHSLGSDMFGTKGGPSGAD